MYQEYFAMVKTTMATLVLVGHSYEERNGSIHVLHLWERVTSVRGDRKLDIQRSGLKEVKLFYLG